MENQYVAPQQLWGEGAVWSDISFNALFSRGGCVNNTPAGRKTTVVRDLIGKG